MFIQQHKNRWEALINWDCICLINIAHVFQAWTIIEYSFPLLNKHLTMAKWIGASKIWFSFFALFVFLRVSLFSQIAGDTKRIQSNELGKYACIFSFWWVFAHIETSIMRIYSPFSSASILDCRINFNCMQKSGWYSIKSIITVDKVRIGEDAAANDSKHTKMEHARNYNNINNC